MDKELLTSIMQVKEYPCISIIMPTHRMIPEKHQNSIRLKNLLKQAAATLENELGKRDSAELIDKMNDLAASIDTSRTQDGLALFISQSKAEVVHIPFVVHERVVINNAFSTRELIMGVNRGTTYYILDLSLHRARLISCYREHAREVTHNGFPMESDFSMLELNPTDFTSEKEKQIREFFNRVDKMFVQQYKTKNTRLILAGVQKNLALYREVSDHPEMIIGHLEGNYESEPLHEMCKKAWEVVREKARKERHSALNEIQRAVSTRKVAAGITEAWRLAQEGRVATLVCEEDYHTTAGIDTQNSLVLDTSELPAENIIPDAVDQLADVVITKGGKVIFVDNGTLGNFYKVAAILRY